MKKNLIFIGFILAIVQGLPWLSAAEFSDGRMKLVLHENTGRFSLYYLTDIKKERYQSLFVDKDPRTSFLSILVNDKSYRLGDSTAFRIKVQNENSKPAIIFQASTIEVVQEFEFIRTGGATLSNGVKMNIRVTNKGEKAIPIGIRFVLDTSLGENAQNHFYTDLQQIPAELALTSKDRDTYWISKNDSLGLMGSINIAGTSQPDLIHFANWKRFNDASWQITSSNGRNFNLLPYSIGDSAVAYYYDPVLIPRGSVRNVAILLTLASDKGFETVGKSIEGDISQLLGTARGTSTEELSFRTDLIMIGDVVNKIDSILAAQQAVSEEELAALETILSKLQEKYTSR
ncbi:hypothetical protein [Gracilinema caldarium]|uniref:Uncharacterized protein n=1 Tax=Gracilinema caldarium (strain ATCC 51460 / DSM 7334 / H1) TaxID=744872 RepID=F8F3D9_GRAC1|nr:hypothetical protein [Gracilinema caldarium]AEJ19515.1 hypothetical protein Spica_1369 [Gracilinema caldarium DSM 7334]